MNKNLFLVTFLVFGANIYSSQEIPNDMVQAPIMDTFQANISELLVQKLRSKQNQITVLVERIFAAIEKKDMKMAGNYFAVLKQIEVQVAQIKKDFYALVSIESAVVQGKVLSERQKTVLLELENKYCNS